MTLNVLIAEDVHDVAEVVTCGMRMNWPGAHMMVSTGTVDILGYRTAQSADLEILDVPMPGLATAIIQRDFLAVNDGCHKGMVGTARAGILAVPRRISGSPHPRHPVLEYTERCRTNLASCMQIA